METNNPSFLQRHAYAIKAIIIGILTLVLLIPTAMIMGLINERERMQDEATNEVSAKWANEQTVTGPILVVPYQTVGAKGQPVIQQAFFLPDKLSVNGTLSPEIRKRGIYEVALYNSQLQLSGSFSAPDAAALNIPATAMLWKEAYLAVGVNDMRGIGNQVQVLWNGQPYVFNPGTPPGDVLQNAIVAKVPVNIQEGDSAASSFTINLELKGSGQVYFSPVGQSTQVNLKAPWPNPSFDGAFLPGKRTVDDKGFDANWLVLHTNRSFPQRFTTENKYDIQTANFGVKLFLPVDGYLKSTRAVKYAILIIGLTFLLFYFIELLYHQSIHPLQYILIGVALCIFYTLLIALAEQLSFNVAYLIAAALTIGLVTAYASSVFKKITQALAVGGTLVTLYGFIYVIIQSEDQALLMGSLGLFIILAIVMFFSRKIKWEELGGNLKLNER